MKYTITVECEDDLEIEAVMRCVKNKLLLDGIYDEVFRPVIKYSENEEDVAAFEKVWEKLSLYLEE